MGEQSKYGLANYILRCNQVRMYEQNNTKRRGQGNIETDNEEGQGDQDSQTETEEMMARPVHYRF